MRFALHVQNLSVPPVEYHNRCVAIGGRAIPWRIVVQTSPVRVLATSSGSLNMVHHLDYASRCGLETLTCR